MNRIDFISGNTPCGKQWLKITTMTAAILVLAGCATLSKEECQVADWNTIGFEDGARGMTTSRIANHRKACAEHGIQPDMAAYQAGHAKGVRSYCQPAKGYRLGTRGRSYNGVCPADLENPFLAAYKEGKKIHAITRSISTKKRQVKAKQKELKTVKEQLAEKEALIIGSGTPPAQRAVLMTETKELNQKQGTLESQLRDLELELAVLEEKLRNARKTVVF